MPNPMGSYQIGSIRVAKNNQQQSSNGNSPVGAPSAPSVDLLVNNGVQPSLISVGSTPVQLDKVQVQNRTSITVQNQGTVTVEIYFNTNNPAFGSGGWQIAAGGFFDFNYTEDVKVYAVTGGTSVNLVVLQNIKR